MKIAGIATLPDSRRSLSAGQPCGPGARARWGAENQGLSGLEAGEETILGGVDGQERIVKDALGEPIRLDTVRPASDGHDIQTTIDAALQTRTEEVLAAGRRAPTRRRRATAVIMDPRTSKVLAMANWPPVDLHDLDQAEPARPRQPGDRVHLRARIDLQGVHRRRRPRGQDRHPGDQLLSAADDQGRRPHDRGGAREAPAPKLDRRLRYSRSPRTSARSRSASSSAPSASASGSTASASATGRESSSRPRSRGSCPPTTSTPAPSIGNLPIGQGLSVTPIQMMAGLRGDRQRRHHAPAAAGRAKSTASRSRSRRATA